MTDASAPLPIEAAPSAAAIAPLTEPQIAWLVDRYKLEMARYEKAATLVGIVFAVSCARRA